MAIKKTVVLNIDTKDAVKGLDKLDDGVENLNKGLIEIGETSGKALENIEKDSKTASKGVRNVGKSFKGLGIAIKALGIGLVLKAFQVLHDLFSQNQKVLDFFNTTFNVVSIAFNDFAEFIFNNFGKITEFIQKAFSLQGLKDFGTAIKENIIERFNSIIKVAGILGDTFRALFAGDFKLAIDLAKEAGKEFVDVITGVDGSFEKGKELIKSVTSAIVDYTKSTIEAAIATTKLANASLIAQALNRGLLEQYDRQAEKLRQIRDDESRSIEDRIEANRKLGEKLDEQEEVMLKNAKLVVDSAKANLKLNDRIENQVALIEAQNEVAAVQAQIEGFRSEQLVNINSLLREKTQIEKDAEKQKKEDKQTDVDSEADKNKRLKKLDEERVKDKQKATDAIIGLVGAETAVGKIAFLAKQALNIQELIEEAKKTITFSSLVAARSAAAIAEGTAQTAKVGFPQNIPLLIAYAVQAASIIVAVKSAIGKAKSIASSIGGGGDTSTSVLQAPTAPQFNVVGAIGTNQIAESVAQQQNIPIKAFVVSKDMTTQQALDRDTESTATFGS